jgi:hypothetical protein
VAQKAGNRRHRPHIGRNHLCTRACDLADSTEGIGFAGCAQSSAGPNPEGCPRAFAAVQVLPPRYRERRLGVEDRIYRSLRTAQDRELQSRPSSAQPDAAVVPSAPVPEAVQEHAIPASHGAVRPADSHGFRWFARGFAADRPRISVVGTLSLSVLISAGLFAAQMIVKPRHKHRAADESVAADSNGAMRVASHQADDAEDDQGAPVSVPSSFRHVHAPAAHSKSQSTHVVALDQQVALDDHAEDSSQTHHGSSASHSVQHPADDNESLRLDDVQGSPQPVDHSTQGPTVSGNHGVSQPVSAEPTSPARPAAQSPSAETVAAPIGTTGQPAFQAAAQPAVTTNSPAMDASSKWPLVPAAATASAAPVAANSGAVQVSAEASNANTPTLTIMPGRPDNLSLPSGVPTPRMQPIPQSQPADPTPARSAEASTALAGQPTSVYPVSQDRPDAATSAQPVASPFDALDRTKVMSFQFRNAPWSLVLANFAKAMGLELRMQAFPDGTFNRWDSARYTPTQTLAILNSELAKIGCQAKGVGTALYIVPATPGDPASSPAVVPAAASSLQLPQYPGVPASATATSGAR